MSQVTMTEDVGPECNCYPSLLAIKRTSHTPSNPGRDFFTCSKRSNDESRCKFFKWVDDYEREHQHQLEIEYELQSALPSQPPSSLPSTAPSSSTQATAFNLSQEEVSEGEGEEEPLGLYITQEALQALIQGMPPTRVPTTPRRSTLGQIATLPATPQSLPKRRIEPQTPEQRAKRLLEIQHYRNESSEPVARGGGTPRPLGGIDDALSNARVFPTTNGSSPLKRTRDEMSSSEDETEYWLATDGMLGGRPSKVQKASAVLLPASEIKGSAGKGKSREVSVGQAGPSRLPSDPENPFEVQNDDAATASQSSTTLTPPTTPSKSLADELERQARALLKTAEDVRRMERRSVASEKSKTAKEVANKRLREDLAEKNELVDAQSAKITELNKVVAVLKGRIAHLEELVEGRRVYREEDN